VSVCASVYGSVELARGLQYSRRASGIAKPSLPFTIHKAYHLAYSPIDRKPLAN